MKKTKTVKFDPNLDTKMKLLKSYLKIVKVINIYKNLCMDRQLSPIYGRACEDAMKS